MNKKAICAIQNDFIKNFALVMSVVLKRVEQGFH